MRSLEEIQNSILAEKELHSELDVLSSSSLVSVWRLWVYITSVTIYLHERIFFQHKTEVEDIANSMQVGKLSWYVSEAEKYQHGFPLSFDNNTFKYLYLDTVSEEAKDARIINRVSAREVFSSNFSGILIKAAKDGDSGLEKLNSSELESFTFYMQRIAFAGIPIDCWSKDADLLKYSIRVWYDGTMPENDALTAIKEAINEYLKAIPFDSILYKNKLIDALQLLLFVNDVEVLGLQSKKPDSDLWIDASRMIEPESGYFKADDSSNIQLIAE